MAVIEEELSGKSYYNRRIILCRPSAPALPPARSTLGHPMKTPVSSLGVIFGNRDFFPDKLVSEARADLVKLFKKLGIAAVMLGAEDTKLGGVETHHDARKCADLFRQNRDHIMGVLVVLPISATRRAWPTR
jgi:hypothetical protein